MTTATMSPTWSDVTIARISTGFRHISTYQAKVSVSAPAWPVVTEKISGGTSGR